MNLTKQEQDNINIIKKYLDSFVVSSRYARSVNYVQSDDSQSNNYLEAIFDCGGYYATITYKTFSYTDGELCMHISFSGCDYRFAVYDVFNLFDIQDFNVYDFQNCIEENGIIKSLQSLTEVIEKYSVDFKNANTNRNISTLIKNRKNDMKSMYYDNVQSDDYINGDYSYVLKYSKLSSKKLLSKLSSKSQSGELTLYEKRLLQYLSYSSEKLDENKKSKGFDFKKAMLIVYIPFGIIAVVIAIAAYFVVKDYTFGANAVTVFFDDDLIPDYLWSIVISILCAFAFLKLIIGETLIIALCSDDEKDVARAKFNQKNNVKSKIFKAVKAVIVLAIFVASIMSTTNAVAFGDSQFIAKYDESFVVDYDDMKVYQVQKWYDDFGKYYSDEEESYYVIEYGDNKFYDVPIMNVDKRSAKTFDKQLKAHNIEVVSVEYPDDINY